MNRAAIFGTGPAGLAAAHAAFLSGYWVTLFSFGVKSELHGCQYLHAEMPELGVSLKSRTVRYQLRGTAAQYRDKVYGDLWAGKVSPQDLQGEHQAWDIRAAYDWLWDVYVDKGTGRATVYEQAVTPQWLDTEMHRLTRNFDKIISTIPLQSICRMGHDFLGNDIWAMGDALDRGQFCPVGAPDETIICNGEDAPAWYRVSRVFGQTTVEWPGARRPPIAETVRVVKPLFTNCNCWPALTRMGRYGAWKKDELVHNVFDNTMELLKNG